MKPAIDNRKSQVTVLIILGIVVLIVFGFIAMLKSGINVPFADKDRVTLKDAIVGCLEMKAAEWLMIHGLYSAQYGKDNNTFGLNNDIITMPTVAEAEAELETFLDNQLIVCAVDFNTQGFKIDINKAEFDVIFKERKVDITYLNLFTATREDKSVSVSKGGFSIGKRVKLAMTNSNNVFENRRNDLYIRDDKTMKQDDLLIEVIRDTEKTENWLVTDGKNPEPYYFSFLVRLLI